MLKILSVLLILFPFISLIIFNIYFAGIIDTLIAVTLTLGAIFCIIIGVTLYKIS